VVFDLADAYVWDFWTAYDDLSRLHHLFFLHAPTSLGDPDLRHRNARVGHAVSDDLFYWDRLDDPLPDPGVHDDLAQWTGCVVRGGDEWWMFTTGLTRADEGEVQRIGAATSPDLHEWTRTDLVLAADPRWYQHETTAMAWRDPFVIRDDEGQWHMYVSARDASGARGSGVVGHAVSRDLVGWEVGPPLSSPTGFFDCPEVIQVVQVEGRWVLLFSCLSHEMPGAAPGSGGVWSVPVDGPGEPVDLASAVRVTDESRYVGKVVHDLGRAHLLAFRNVDDRGDFVGGVIDPLPVAWRTDGRGLTTTVPVV
jgi:beta-fructofuranosidase